MSAVHTPGPWVGKLKTTPFSDLGIYGDKGALVATVAHNPRFSSAGRRKADAQLLSASPELLAALVEAIEDSEEVLASRVAALGENYRPNQLWAMRVQIASGRAAIAKATRIS